MGIGKRSFGCRNDETAVSTTVDEAAPETAFTSSQLCSTPLKPVRTLPVSRIVPILPLSASSLIEPHR
jgi:hypothetical protein